MEGIQWKIGRGNIINFWEDEWLRRGSLKSQFPRVYNLVARKNVMVEELFKGRDGRSRWDIDLVKNLND